MWRNDFAPAVALVLAGPRRCFDFRRPGPRGGRLARRALLQQQFGGLDDRLGVKAVAHHAVENRVGDRNDRHALMVRHEGANERESLTFRQPAGREVHRFVKAVTPPSAHLG